MSYEVLLLTELWFFDSQEPHHFKILTEILNKGYAKARDRYQIVASPRINQPEDLVSDLHLIKGNNVFLAILLGSDEKWNEIETGTGFFRTFNPDISSNKCSFDSDVPSHILEMLGPLSLDPVRFVKFEARDSLNRSIQKRVLATCAFQSLDGLQLSPWRRQDRTQCYELTGFTSFGRKMGTQFLQFCINQFFANPDSRVLPSTQIDRYFICCTVIAEHNLVSYYTQQCGFSKSDKEDIFFLHGENAVGLEVNMKFNKSFHIAFLHREVLVQGQDKS